MTTTPEALTLELKAAEFLSVEQMRKASEKLAQELRDKIIEHASGRPGPNIVTGEYITTITVEPQYSGDSVNIMAGSSAPQSMRLELGFVGRDASGRAYNQPPFPHFRPAADELEARWEELMADCGDLNVLSNRGDD